MTRIKTLAAALVAGLLIAVGLLAGPAQATQKPVSYHPGECGEALFSADADYFSADNAQLVVAGPDGTTAAPVGAEAIQVGPFYSDSFEPVTIYYRAFGGGERDDDIPLWNGYGEPGFKDDINAYGSQYGWGWTIAGPDDPNPFTTWKTVEVTPCVEVTPGEPIFTHPVCDDPGFAEIPEQGGVVFDPAESFELVHGDMVTVTATPDEGYVFRDGDVSEWSFTAIVEGCDGDDGDDGDDGSDGDDGADGKDGSDGSDGTDGTDGTDGSDDGAEGDDGQDTTPKGVDRLPDTGMTSDQKNGGIIGAALVTVGGLFLALRRFILN
jgi:LPXTG-motif cell wall-anchored protein